MNSLFSMLKNSRYIFIIIFLFSCTEKGVNIDLPYEGNKLVLNSLMLKDSFIYARLTNSSQFNNSYIFPVPSGAKVDLYENDILKETMDVEEISGTDYFVSSFKAQQGKRYTLKAFADNMDNVEGSDIIPSKPTIQGISFKKIGAEHKVQVKLKDNFNEKNFYRVRIFTANTVNNQVQVNKYPNYFSIENWDLNESGIFTEVSEQESFFTDEKFDGKEITFTLNLKSYYYEDATHIAVEFQNLTADAYKYLSSVYLQDPHGISPVVEPVMVYNNIKGGYGIVGGLGASMVTIKKQ